MGIFDKIRNIEHLNETELKYIGQSESSWHDTYQNSSYIYIGNLDKSLTEGDLIVIFSQFGEPIDINLVRDEETGESKGYCFLAYADQRSTILAVDNFIGYKLLERPLVVDHVLNYRLPKKYVEKDGQTVEEYKPTGAEGKGIGVYNVLSKEGHKKEDTENEDQEEESFDHEKKRTRKFKESLKRKYTKDDSSEEDDRDREKKRKKFEKDKYYSHKNKEISKRKHVDTMESRSSDSDREESLSRKRKYRSKDKERNEERKKEKDRGHRKHNHSKHKSKEIHGYKRR